MKKLLVSFALFNWIWYTLFQTGTSHDSILKSAINEAYGMDFVNAKRVLKTKFKRKNKDGLTLADRIRMNRYGNGVSTIHLFAVYFNRTFRKVDHVSFTNFQSKVKKLWHIRNSSCYNFRLKINKGDSVYIHVFFGVNPNGVF